MTKDQKESVLMTLEAKENNLLRERFEKEVIYRASQSAWIAGKEKDSRLGGAMTGLKEDMNFIEDEIRHVRELIKELKGDKCEINV